jgi:hypothetical protein
LTPEHSGTISIEMHDEAMVYIDRYLQRCSALLDEARRLLRHTNTQIHARAPEPVVSAGVNLTRFSESILMYMSEGQAKPSLIGDLVDMISNHLREECHICLIQDTLTTDGGRIFPPNPDLNYLRYGMERYILLTPDDATNFERILDAVEEGYFTQWQFAGILTYTSEASLLMPKNLSFEEVIQLAANTRTLFVGAYDGESYLTWSVT